MCKNCSVVDSWSRTECRRCASVTNDIAGGAADLDRREDCSPGACMSNDEPISAGKRVLERELERHQKKLKRHEERGEAHRGPNRIGSTESPKASRPRARSWRKCRRVSKLGTKLQEQLARRSRYSEKTCYERTNRWTKNGPKRVKNFR